MANEKIRMLYVDEHGFIIGNIVREDSEYVYVDEPSLVFAEQSKKQQPEGTGGGTIISYVPFAPFYADRKEIPIRKDHISVGLSKEVDINLKEKYLEMINPSKILMPKTKLIV